VDDMHIKTTIGEIWVSFRAKARGMKKRDFEKGETHRLIQKFDFNLGQLSYGLRGNPLLSAEAKFISISHSDGWFSVYVGSSPLGVDIQTIHPRMVKAKPYFCNEQDSHWNDVLDLHLIWGAKEALFKKIAGETDDLAKDVTILDIDHSTSRISARCQNQTEKLAFCFLDKTVLVYTLD
jgi:phosphopantetheinyl transferase